MQGVIEWLLSLKRVGLDDPGKLSLRWLEPLDAWMWFIICLAVAAYVFLIYRRDGGGRKIRILLASLRAALIILALLLLCRPAVVYRRDRTEPSTVAVVLDHSASMAREDHYDNTVRDRLTRFVRSGEVDVGGGAARTLSRWEIVQAIFTNPESALLEKLLDHHEVRYFEFSGSASSESLVRDRDSAAKIAARLSDQIPTGSSTHIARSIDQVLRSCIDAHLAGIVLVTDGRSTQEEDWEKTVRTATARGAGIYIVPVGSPHPPKDLAVEAVQADSHVYLRDKAAVSFTLRASGLLEPVSLDVRLKDARTDEILARKALQVSQEQFSRTVELQFEPRSVGETQLVVEVLPLEQEFEVANNAQQFRITVIDEKVKVLYVDGYPRYEYRYLKNMLIREPSTVASTLLLSADVDFVQEGDEPIRRFPTTAEELGEYDVVLFGDVDPRAGWITNAQLELIADFVSNKGGGFGLIAGERHTPRAFYGTPIERLIAVEIGGGIGGDSVTRGWTVYKPQLTSAGRESPIFRLLMDEEESLAIFEHLPPWYWAYPTPAVKPGTEILMQHPGLQRYGTYMPIVVVGRHGAGTTFYQGSDDSWRWRRHRGEGFFDTYWLQVVRYLARRKKIATDASVRLRTNLRTVDPARPIVMMLEFDDAATALQVPEKVSVSIRSSQGVKLAEPMLTRLTANSKHFQGSFLSKEVGQLEVVFQPRRYGLDLPDVRAFFEVDRQSLEDRKPEANVEMMARLAESTGGKVVQPWDAATIPDLIPDRKYVVPDDIVETVWDSKLAMMMFVILIGAEWILRKLNGLV